MGEARRRRKADLPPRSAPLVRPPDVTVERYLASIQARAFKIALTACPEASLERIIAGLSATLSSEAELFRILREDGLLPGVPHDALPEPPPPQFKRPFSPPPGTPPLPIIPPETLRTPAHELIEALAVAAVEMQDERTVRTAMARSQEATIAFFSAIGIEPALLGAHARLLGALDGNGDPSLQAKTSRQDPQIMWTIRARLNGILLFRKAAKWRLPAAAKQIARGIDFSVLLPRSSTPRDAASVLLGWHRALKSPASGRAPAEGPHWAIVTQAKSLIEGCRALPRTERGQRLFEADLSWGEQAITELAGLTAGQDETGLLRSGEDRI